MATNKPRITISLDQDTYDVLTEYADVMGRSLAGCVSEFVEDRKGKMKLIIEKSIELENLVNNVD